MPEEKTISRRNWLKTVSLYGLVGTAFACLGAIFLEVWLAAGRFTTAHWSQVTTLEEVSAEGTVPFPGQRVAIIRRGKRLGALSLECSHLGCLVNAVDKGFFCPCHGSEFGPLGEVYSGPAPIALPWYALQIRNGQLWIHTGRKLANPVWVSLDQNNPAQGENHDAHS